MIPLFGNATVFIVIVSLFVATVNLKPSPRR